MTALLIASPFFVMGIIPLLIGLFSYKKGKRYFFASKVTVGEITDVVRGARILDEPRGWYPTIRYLDERTNSYSIFKSNTGHAFKFKFTIGNKIELRYLYTDKGIDIRTNTPMAIYGISKHLIVAGSILTAFSIISMLLMLFISYY